MTNDEMTKDYRSKFGTLVLKEVRAFRHRLGVVDGLVEFGPWAWWFRPARFKGFWTANLASDRVWGGGSVLSED